MSVWREITIEEVSLLHADIESIVTGWYIDQRLDRHEICDRLEGMTLPDGHRLDLGTEMSTPVIDAVMKYARAFKREVCP